MTTPVERAANNLDAMPKYEDILRQSRQMVNAAREGDWDMLIALEQLRAATSKALMDRARSHGNLPAGHPGNAALISDILACDEETRRLIEPRQRELKTTFSSMDTEKKLHKAYDMAC